MVALFSRSTAAKCLICKPHMGLLSFLEQEMAERLRERLIELTEPLLARLGYEMVDLEFAPGRSGATLRVFIDRDSGTGIEDCERVSREMSAMLDVEDPVPMAYTLEVSTPGADRVLRKPAHFERFQNERIWVELKAPRGSRRRYTGTLASANPAGIVVVVDGEPVNIGFDEIECARLAPLWS